MKIIPYGRQQIEEDDIAAVTKVLRSDFLTTGPEIKLFEDEIAAFCDVKYAVVCANGTAALHIAALAAGLKTGDTAITSPITFVATANCARYCGADVAFADIDSDTGNIDPGSVAKLISEKPVKAILPVHLAGTPARLEEIWELASTRGITVIEDASHAIGAQYKTKAGSMAKIGSCQHSHMTTFSFHPVKQMTTGEGGAVLTNDRSLYEKLLFLRGHGITHNSEKWQFIDQGFAEAGQANPWYYEMQELGFNYRLTDVQCALGRSQLRKLERFINRRRELVKKYSLKLAEFPEIMPIIEPAGAFSAYHLFIVQIDFQGFGVTRSQVMARMREQGVGSQVHYIPVNRQPYYSNLGAPLNTPLADAYYQRCLSLPLFPSMTDMDVHTVVQALTKALREPI